MIHHQMPKLINNLLITKFNGKITNIFKGNTVKPELTTTSEERPPVYNDHHFAAPSYNFTS